MKNTHGWLFHKNAYTNKWHAARREDIHLLFNDIQNPKVLRSSSIATLEELINRTNGDESQLNELVNKVKKHKK